MIKKLAVFLAGALCVSVSAHADWTVGQYVDEIASKDSARKAVVIGLLRATYDGIGWVNFSIKNDRKQSPFYCEPEAISTKPKFFVEMIVPKLNDTISLLANNQGDKVVRNYPISAVMLITLQKAYPCP